MHLGVERHVNDERCEEGLEGAAVVTDWHAGSLGAQSVGELLGDLSGDELLLPVDPPAHDDVVSFVHLAEELPDIARVVLQVAVHGHQDLAAGVLEPAAMAGVWP